MYMHLLSNNNINLACELNLLFIVTPTGEQRIPTSLTSE